MSSSRNSWSLLFVMFRPSRFNSGLSQSRARLTMRAVRLLAVLACTSLLFTAVSCQDADDELPPLLQACRAQVRCPSGTGYFRDRTVRFRALRARPSPRLTPRSPTLARFLLSQLKDVTRKFKDNSAVVTKYHEMSDKLHASIAEKMALKAEVAALEEQLAAVASRPDPGVTELFVQLVSATWNLTSEVAPAYAAEIYRDVATVVGPAAAAAADRVAGAVSAAAPSSPPPRLERNPPRAPPWSSPAAARRAPPCSPSARSTPPSLNSPRARPPSRRSRRTPPRPTPGSSCRCCSRRSRCGSRSARSAGVCLGEREFRCRRRWRRRACRCERPRQSPGGRRRRRAVSRGLRRGDRRGFEETRARPPSLGRSDRRRATFFDSRDIFSDDSIGIRTDGLQGRGGGVDGRDPTRARGQARRSTSREKICDDATSES